MTVTLRNVVLRRWIATLAASLMLFVGGAAWNIGLTMQIADDAREASRQAVGSQQSSCQSTNEFRVLFRDLLATLAEPPPDPATIDGYSALDPAARRFVDSVIDADRVRAEGAARALDAHKQQFPIIDC